MRDSNAPIPASLSAYPAIAERWLDLSAEAQAATLGSHPCSVNDEHYSIHDQITPFAGAGPDCGGVVRGASVHPTPMDGTELIDGDSGKCRGLLAYSGRQGRSCGSGGGQTAFIAR